MKKWRRMVRPLLGSLSVAMGLALTFAFQSSPSSSSSSSGVEGDERGGVGSDVGHLQPHHHHHHTLFHLPHLPHLLPFISHHESHEDHESHSHSDHEGHEQRPDESAMAAMVDGAEHDLANRDGEHLHHRHEEVEEEEKEEAHRDESRYGYGSKAANASGNMMLGGGGGGGGSAGGDDDGGGCPSLSGGGKVSVAGKMRKGWVMHAHAGAGEGAAGQYAHMPSLARTASGRLIAAWQGAKHGEGGNDQSLFTSVALDPAGVKWASPRRVGSRGGGGGGGHARQVGARWGPVLFQPSGGRPLHLFYSEGVTCWFCRDPRCRVHMLSATTGGGGSGGGSSSSSFPPGVRPAEWRAGGTIFVVTSADDGATWGPRRLVLAENHEGHVPKVVANPPVVLNGGGGAEEKNTAGGGGEEWLLPYWRQNPRGPAHCKATGRDWAGVVASTDGGATWHARGKITQHGARNPAVDRLIEGAIVPPPPPLAAAVAPAAPARRRLQDAPHLHHLHDHHHHGGHHHEGDGAGGRGTRGVHYGQTVSAEGGEQLLQLFRTSRNVTYGVTSTDRGRSWSRPFPLKDLPNPNTKLHAARLTGGQLVVAYNHHHYKFRQRSNLYVAVAAADAERESKGESTGESAHHHVSAHRPPRFKVLAKLEGRFAEGVMFHYPQMLQVGCTLHIIYGEHQKGIRLASLQLKGEGGGVTRSGG